MKNFISIPKPCNENWDSMTPQEQGRHCTKCNFVVTDFSAMSNEEILLFLSKNTGRVCGRVDQDQLYQTQNITTKLKRFLYALAMAFLPFFSLTSISTLISPKVYAQTNTGSIEGKIVDDKGKPVPFATIGVLLGDSVMGQTKTDFNGNYKIKPLYANKYKLIVRSAGFSNLEIKGIEIREQSLTTKNVTMKKKTRCVTLGIIIRKPMLDPKYPGKQEISGDEIRNLNGG